MQFSEAFGCMRALKDGFEAFKKAWAPMFLGGALMAGIDYGCQGSGGRGSDSPDLQELRELQELQEELQELDDDLQERRQELQELQGMLDNGVSEASAFAVQAAEEFSLPQLAINVLGDLMTGFAMGLLVVVATVLLMLGAMLFRSFIYAGFVKVHQEILVTGTSSVRTLFSGADRTLDMFRVHLLAVLILAGVTTIAGIPGGVLTALALQHESMALGVAGGAAFCLITLPALLYVSLGMELCFQVVVLEHKAPFPALTRSRELVSGNRLWMLLFRIFMVVFITGSLFGGLLTAGFGALVLTPIARAIYDFGYTQGFLLLTRPPEEIEAWRI